MKHAATSTAVPLSFVGGGVSPGIDAKASGAFTANLLFEMNPAALGYPNAYSPLLDKFDYLPTNTSNSQGTSGPALTQFSYGFYYTLPSSVITLDQHDADVKARLDAIKGDTSTIKSDTDFLKTETHLGFLEIGRAHV